MKGPLGVRATLVVVVVVLGNAVLATGLTPARLLAAYFLKGLNFFGLHSLQITGLLIVGAASTTLKGSAVSGFRPRPCLTIIILLPGLLLIFRFSGFMITGLLLVAAIFKSPLVGKALVTGFAGSLLTVCLVWGFGIGGLESVSVPLH